MRVTDVPRVALKLQYQLARLPLQVIGDQLVARLDQEAPARLWYEGSLGKLDAAVGDVLGDEDLQRRGAALLDRSAELGRAAELDAAASERIEEADTELKQTAERVKERQRGAQAAKAEAVRDARQTAEERKRNAVRTVQKGTATAKKQADTVAARRKDAARAAEQKEKADIRAAERAVTADAADKGRAAAAKRNAAADAEARADRVESLADTEQQSRN